MDFPFRVSYHTKYYHHDLKLVWVAEGIASDSGTMMHSVGFSPHGIEVAESRQVRLSLPTAQRSFGGFA